MVRKNKLMINLFNIKALIVLMVTVFIFYYKLPVNASISLEKNDKDQYCINSIEDYHRFLNDLCCLDENDKRETYENATVVLTDDITLETIDIDATYAEFKGVLDGKGHRITYCSRTKDEGEAYNAGSYEKTSLMPFHITGKIKNLKIELDNYQVYTSLGSSYILIFYNITGSLDGITISGDVNCVFDSSTSANLVVTTLQSIMPTEDVIIKNCCTSINYKLDQENSLSYDELQSKFTSLNSLKLFQMGECNTSGRLSFRNCYFNGKYDDTYKRIAEDIRNDVEINNTNKRPGIWIGCIASKNTNSTVACCYYNETTMPELTALSIKLKSNYYDKYNLMIDGLVGKSTEEMKLQSTYEGFNFDKKWSISADINDGYPYYNPKITEVELKAKLIVEDKVWNCLTPKDQNRYEQTDTYYYPYVGDNNVTVSGVEFCNLSDEEKSLVDTYGLSLTYNLEEDVLSATTNMDFLGKRPVSIEWNRLPEITGTEIEKASDDGYEFVLKLEKATCNVLDDGAEGITPDQWETYFNKAKEACNIIFKYGEKKGAFGNKENPSYENTEIWSVFSAARCGYLPYDDPDYFNKWFKNTKEYLQKMKDEGTYGMKNTERAKLILAIEAIGYDPRDISSVDLLSDVGKYIDKNYTYDDEYTVHAIKSGGYSSKSFTDSEIEEWVHKKAKDLKEAQDNVFANADNALNWQPLVYWYGQIGFEDVTEAINSAIPRFASIGQRASGAFCTEGFETQCPTFGNNAWNNAQALLFAGSFGVNVLDQNSGFTKNGNNILDAVFDQINFEDGTVPGFSNYDPDQVARGLNAIIREYEKDVLGKDVPGFWIFSDVEVPTRAVNDAILALNEKSTKEEIAAARQLYEALDDTHKAIFNQTYYQDLVDYETGGKQSVIPESVLKKGDTFVSVKNKFKVTKISGKKGEVAFSGTTNKKLKKISVPAAVNYKGYSFKVTSIAPKALKGYKGLSNLVIGKNVKSIGKLAFSNCKKLKKITIKSKSLKKVGAKAFKGIHKNAVIKVPKKKLKVYKKILK